MTRSGITCGLLMAALIMAGCTKESEPGGPGAGGATTTNGTTTNGTTTNGTTTNGTTTTPGVDNPPTGEAEEHTFTLEVPTQQVDITQGKSQEVSLSIDREDEFHQAVTLTFTAPAGVTVTPKTIEVAADQEDVKVQVAIADTVAPGEVLITVDATPQTGKAVAQTFTVNVDAP